VGSRRIHWRRVLVVSVGLFVILGGLAGLKFWQISTLMAVGEAMEKAGPPPEAVGSAVAQAQSWEVTLHAVGTVTGVESVTVSNEVPGVVSKLRFESGDMVKEGQALVELDASVEEAQLAAAEARRDLAKINVERTRELVRKDAVTQQELDSDEAALEAAESDVSGVQAQIDNKIVRAPFAGRAGIRAVNLGQYLAPGTTVTTVDSIGDVWIDFTVPQEHLPRLRVGTPVRVSLRGQPPLDGAISAIDPTIDPATRSIKLRASLADKRVSLRSGMFVTVEVVFPAKRDVVVIPATAIVRAPYGDSVFLIQDKPPGAPGMSTTPQGQPVKIARQQFVRLGEMRGDFVAVLEGLEPGQNVVAFGAFKLRNGSPIVIDNRVQPTAKLDPHPENR
jgi:membrane fusion protein (multidrug efflux system)